MANWGLEIVKKLCMMVISFAAKGNRSYTSQSGFDPATGGEFMNNQEPSGNNQLPRDLNLVKLTLEQIKRLDELLAEIGDYGQLHIIIEHGDLRYVNEVKSHKFWDLEKKKK